MRGRVSLMGLRPFRPVIAQEITRSRRTGFMTAATLGLDAFEVPPGACAAGPGRSDPVRGRGDCPARLLVPRHRAAGRVRTKPHRSTRLFASEQQAVTGGPLRSKRRACRHRRPRPTSARPGCSSSAGLRRAASRLTPKGHIDLGGVPVPFTARRSSAARKIPRRCAADGQLRHGRGMFRDLALIPESGQLEGWIQGGNDTLP
jgi:hypothetical protein